MARLTASARDPAPGAARHWADWPRVAQALVAAGTMMLAATLAIAQAAAREANDGQGRHPSRRQFIGATVARWRIMWGIQEVSAGPWRLSKAILTAQRGDRGGQPTPLTPDGAAAEPTVDTADLIVIGAGAAGMTPAALVASIEGLLRDGLRERPNKSAARLRRRPARCGSLARRRAAGPACRTAWTALRYTRLPSSALGERTSICKWCATPLLETGPRAIRLSRTA